MKTEALLVILFLFQLIIIAIQIYSYTKSKKSGENEAIDSLKKDINDANSTLRQELVATTGNAIGKVSEVVSTMQKNASEQVEARLKTFETMNETKLENIRITVQKQLTSIQEDNNKRLDEMRNTVDKKLQDTLDNKLTQSFKVVSDRLEQVHKGLGEMQSVAVGVNDLKKVLSNVKTRGVLGEVQLSALLSNILTKSQYMENFSTKKGSADRVEFAIKLPNSKDDVTYLPIDAKFPADVYIRLQDAYNDGDKAKIDEARKMLENSIDKSAKYIRDKYIEPPFSTEFGVLFLPFEGLYSEVVGLGLLESVQQKYRIIIAGPSNMGALLNTLQMMYKVVAIQEKSNEVWKLLSGVKSAFVKFDDTLRKAQDRITKANEDLDELVGKKSKAIVRSLSSVDILEGNDEVDIIASIESKTTDD